jgi:hypothetical protein
MSLLLGVACSGSKHTNSPTAICKLGGQTWHSSEVKEEDLYYVEYLKRKVQEGL